MPVSAVDRQMAGHLSHGSLGRLRNDQDVRWRLKMRGGELDW